MAYVFGFDVNLLEIIFILNVIVLIVLAFTLYEAYRLKKLIDEALGIEKMHALEKAGK
jgi:hypothetical protein